MFVSEILSNYYQRKISKLEAINTLKQIAENSSRSLVLSALEALAKISGDFFDYFRDFAVAHDDIKVRAKALKLLICNHPKKSADLIMYIIENWRTLKTILLIHETISTELLFIPEEIRPKYKEIKQRIEDRLQKKTGLNINAIKKTVRFKYAI